MIDGERFVREVSARSVSGDKTLRLNEYHRLEVVGRIGLNAQTKVHRIFRLDDGTDLTIQGDGSLRLDRTGEQFTLEHGPDAQ